MSAYAEFGREMLHNQFLFQTVLNLVKGQETYLTYKVQTGKYEPINRTIDWVPDFQ